MVQKTPLRWFNESKNMPKTLIFSAPQGDTPDMKLTIDSSGRNFVIDLGDGYGDTDCSIDEGMENQTADLFQALADQARTLVPPPGRPSSFVREWTKVEAELGTKMEILDWTPTRIVSALDEGVMQLGEAILKEDERATTKHLTAITATLMVLSHKLGARVGERIEKCLE